MESESKVRARAKALVELNALRVLLKKFTYGEIQKALMTKIQRIEAQWPEHRSLQDRTIYFNPN